MTDSSTKSRSNPHDLSEQLIDQSLVGLMYVGILGLFVCVYRLIQFGLINLVIGQLVAITVVVIVLYFRHVIPRPVVLVGVCLLLTAVSVIGLIRFGLTAPALIVAIVLPVIIGSVRGMKPGLLYAGLMILLVVCVGVLNVFGFIQPVAGLHIFMSEPMNWVIYLAVYSAMVVWATYLTSSLTDHWQASLRDLKAAEDETLHEREVVTKLQRQQSIVQLSGGVAHDFNNILAAITTNIEIAQLGIANQKSVNSTVNDSLQDALDAADKGAGLTNSLLAFANVAVLEPKRLDINAVIERSISWIARTIPENIILNTELANDAKPILVDEASLSSALLNLIINARDAMPDGGRLTIETSNVEVMNNDENPRFSQVAVGHYVKLVVEDSGSGIAISEQENIFEPFYSTKSRTDSSGLGLAMVQGFMKQSGGTVYVKSKPGMGASFHLLFPTSTRSTQNIDSNVLVRQKPQHPGTRLMIVEDEPIILNSLKTMLTAAGYEVLVAPSGDQAWKALCNDFEVEVVLSDVVMPGTLQGTDLARKIQKSMPGLPVILMSGYPLNVTEDLSPLDVGQVLKKPISRLDLIDAIERAMSSRVPESYL